MFEGSAQPYQVPKGDYVLYVTLVVGQPLMNIQLMPDWQKNIVNVPAIMFRGGCAPSGQVHVGVTGIDSPEYNAFVASKALDDFPYQAQLDLIREELLYQCPEMKNISVELTGDYLEEELRSWQASLRPDNDWQLSAYNPSVEPTGSVAVSFRSHNDEYLSQPIRYNLGADYEGECESEISVPISVFPSRHNGRYLPDMASYEWAAGNFISRFLQHCPDTQRINFTMDPVPEDYSCEEGCDVFASAENGWGFESGDVIEYSEFTGLGPEFVSSFKEALDILAGEESSKVLLGDLFRSFYHRYLSHYSVHCQAYIDDPVPFQFTFTETTSDEWGNELYSNTEVSDNVTYVERRYAASFENFYTASSRQAMRDVFGAVLKAATAGKPVSVDAMAYHLLREDQYIINHLEEGCLSEEVQTVYENLYFAAHPYEKPQYKNNPWNADN